MASVPFETLAAVDRLEPDIVGGQPLHRAKRLPNQRFLFRRQRLPLVEAQKVVRKLIRRKIAEVDPFQSRFVQIAQQGHDVRHAVVGKPHRAGRVLGVSPGKVRSALFEHQVPRSSLQRRDCRAQRGIRGPNNNDKSGNRRASLQTGSYQHESAAHVPPSTLARQSPSIHHGQKQQTNDPLPIGPERERTLQEKPRQPRLPAAARHPRNARPGPRRRLRGRPANSVHNPPFMAARPRSLPCSAPSAGSAWSGSSPQGLQHARPHDCRYRGAHRRSFLKAGHRQGTIAGDRIIEPRGRSRTRPGHDYEMLEMLDWAALIRPLLGGATAPCNERPRHPV